MNGGECFFLFDDARTGGTARLYRGPDELIVANRLEEVEPALERIRSAVAGGRHAAGLIAYEAGFALDPAFHSHAPAAEGPLLCFGLFDGFETPRAENWLPGPDGGWIGAPAPQLARDLYLDRANAIREHLFAGNIYQANFTFPCDVPLLGDPLAVYARLRRSARAGWGGVARIPGAWILSLSPEQFFTLRDGLLEARPMKGTAVREPEPARDRAAAEALRRDEKQRAENLMIVDLLRNDLARVAEPGSVAVPELFVVETYPTVHQMVSRVTARLRAGCDAIDVIRTIFPCGSITGAPKISAMAILRQLERRARAFYTGSMGWIEPGGDASFNVLIRTLELADGAPQAKLGLGSGLVIDSKAGDEWQECLAKGAFVTRAQPSFDLIETMRFDPQEGMVELDRHLDRLASAAKTLGFPFDRHDARNELQAATFGRQQPAMARLLLSPSGAIAIEVRTIEAPDRLPVDVALRPLPVPASDYRLRFKTTDRSFYDDARRDSGAFETVFTDPEGRVTEGSFTCVFVERDGTYLTPPLERGVLPSILRAKLIEEGRAHEADLSVEDLKGGFFVGNMVRGLLPARLQA